MFIVQCSILIRSGHRPPQLELQTNLACKRAESRLRIDFSESTGIDIQVGIPRRRMVEQIRSVHTDLQVFGLCNPDILIADLSTYQNVAIGLSGDPVPPLMGSGAAVSRNSQRLRAAAASLRASRSQLSIK